MHPSCLLLLILLLALAALPVPQPAQAASSVEQWDLFEVSLSGPSAGNPFTDVEFSARFTQGARSLSAAGFYDGGMYRVRFMPDTVGEWRYETRSNRPELDAKSGTFNC